MRESLKEYYDRFVSNRNALKIAFKSTNDMLIPICASKLTEKCDEIDINKLKHCEALLKSKTGAFSVFRGEVKLPIVISMAISENPEKKLIRILEVYEELLGEFHSSEYLAIGADALAELAPEGSVAEYVTRGKEIYKRMKKEHPFLTSGEDSVFAVMLAFSEKQNDDLILCVENCYDRLKKSLNADNDALQTLSHILSMTDGSWVEKCERVELMWSLLKDAGLKYGKGFEIAALGTVAILPLDIEYMVHEMAEIDLYLSKTVGYKGAFGVDKRTRLLHALLVTMGYSARDFKDDASLTAMVGALAMIAAEEAAMAAVIAATVVMTTCQ